MTKAEIIKMVMTASLNQPYIYGGNHPTQSDCSGQIQLILASIGMDPPGDQNAQMLHDHFLKTKKVLETPTFGDLLFFGKDPDHVSHVAMAVNENFMYESGGGDSSTKTQNDAFTRNAFVRIRPIHNRKDLLCCIAMGINE